MKLRKIALIVFALMIVIASCTPDDDGTTTVPARDRTEVYAEDLLEIETFLETHYLNLEDNPFDFVNLYNPDNDDFKIVFSELEAGSTEVALIDMPQLKFKTVEDPSEEGLFYKLYYLEMRQGLGNEVHFIDEVFVTYEGSTTESIVFDDAINPINFELTSVLNGGVVTGFMESLIEFKTATSFDTNNDGTSNYHNHGIGAAFLPSGLAYFNQVLEDVSSYTPLIFKFNVLDRVLLDHDNDGIPSFLEDLDNNSDVFDDDTNDDTAPNFFDGDDDGDGTNTIDEITIKSYTVDDNMIAFASTEEANDYFENGAEIDENEVFISVEYTKNTATTPTVYTLKTFVATDSNGNGTADYLDETYPED
ncbi:hypothetical protein Q4512_12570 [Oceanihabitans sp. 2_MG-2023]|uniref:FKBP-type peptidyl-prolyl cis-trans isomerase n=1 Tax=Oceanihabitans sp. 2_MG-2023 TaxID=3062661 RepID=UPI0026E16889|nr:hypothetical protein [Oceanihabitans sp. 2_MG-2023]MDO6597751.1 hypothetical protein [Oceanihabitans sp. 2_MG-2023]